MLDFARFFRQLYCVNETTIFLIIKVNLKIS